MSDLAKARELERLRYSVELSRLNVAEQDLIRKQDADFAARGLLQSGPRLLAAAKARIDKIESGINARLDIRKELAQSFPELASGHELDNLMAEISTTLEHATQAVPQDTLPGAVRAAMTQRVNQDFDRLRANAKVKIEILKREFALKLHEQPDSRPISVQTGGGPALINLGTIGGQVQQVIGDVNGAGYGEFAALLQQLAAAISQAEVLGEKRTACLEQLAFIASEATEPPEKQRTSVVKGLFVALRAGLEDASHLAGVMSLVGPALARHFGLPWPF